MKSMIKLCPDNRLGQFILDVAKLCAKVDTMTALDNLKLSLRRAKMFTCSICGRQFNVIFTCEVCGARGCADHIVREQTAPDDYRDVCINCLEDEHDRK